MKTLDDRVVMPLKMKCAGVGSGGPGACVGGMEY